MTAEGNDPADSRPVTGGRTGSRGAESRRSGRFLIPLRLFGVLTGFGIVPILAITLWEGGIDQFAEQATVLGTAAACIAILAAVIAAMVARRISRSIRVIADTATSIAAGDDRALVPPLTGPDDVQHLRDAFNAMLDAMRWRGSEARRARREAELANEGKNRFLGHIGQGIRAPLLDMVGMIELLQTSQVTAPQRRQLDAAAQSGQTLLRLVEDVLDLNSIEAGRLELDRTAFHLPSLVHDLRVAFADRIRAKGLTLWTSLPDELNVMLIGDKVRLMRILNNLVGNALKFTNEGSITVRASLLRDTGAAMRVRFEISDTGVGIGPERLETLFDGFSRSDFVTDGAFASPGLGLALCQQLCRLMGGDMSVESVPGSGSIFAFTVVMDQQRPGAVALPSVRQPIAETAPLFAPAAMPREARRPAAPLGPPPALRPAAAPALPAPTAARPAAPSTAPPRPDLVRGIELLPARPELATRGASYAPSDYTPAIQPVPADPKPVAPSETPPAKHFGRRPEPMRRPAANQSPAAREFRAAMDRLGRDTIAVMVVEDNPANMRVTQALLETLGIQVVTARNGLEAVAAYREGPVDMILMDCQMPEMDGYEATRAIRQIESFQGHRTPILALTAHAMEGSREASLESGMDDQITKPLTMAILTDKLLEWIKPL